MQISEYVYEVKHSTVLDKIVTISSALLVFDSVKTGAASQGNSKFGFD